MARYKESNLTQGQFLTVNLSEQLIIGTFEWTLNYLIGKMDLSSFDKKYNNDEKGACAYSPGVLLKIVLYCYSKGILTSRKIEEACRINITIKALAEDSEPDHSTIAEFISTNSEAVKELFVQVLMQCQELDLITGEMFAGDGCKLSSNASKEWSETVEKLKKRKEKLDKYIKKIIKRHRELDKSEEVKKKQKKYIKTMGDDKERRKRHVKRIEKRLERLNEFLKTAEPKKGVSRDEIKTNVTDPESALIKSPHGYIQGYNGIAVADSGNQVIICAEAVGFGTESGSFPKMLDSLKENMTEITGKNEPLKKAMYLGDTGFFSEDNLQEAANRGIEVIIPDQQFRQRDPDFDGRKEENKKTDKFTQEDFTYDKKQNIYICPAGKILTHKGRAKLRNNEGERYHASVKDCRGCSLIKKCIKKRTAKNPIKRLYVADQKYEENLSAKMRDKIDDPAYREIYSRRQQIIEPVFADITYCKGMDRFTLRGTQKVDIQWKLYCIVHNIGKCINSIGSKFSAKQRKKKIKKAI